MADHTIGVTVRRLMDLDAEPVTVRTGIHGCGRSDVGERLLRLGQAHALHTCAMEEGSDDLGGELDLRLACGRHQPSTS